MIAISLVARKGGVGRTSLTWNLAGAFALEGGRILCVDLDGQSSLSRVAFGNEFVESLRPTETIAAVFSGCDPDPRSLIQKTAFDNIHVVPSGNALDVGRTTPVRECAILIGAAELRPGHLRRLPPGQQPAKPLRGPLRSSRVGPFAV